jgi:C_GCAxxG_C_C family probable redox protein
LSEKNKLVEKARQLGKEYMLKYGGCAPATLLAVADTLNLEVSDELFKAITGFSSLAEVCGNVAGGVAAMGLKFGVGRKDYEKNPEIGFASFAKLMITTEVLRKKFAEEYGGILCDEVQMKLYGRCKIFPTSPEELEAFSKQDPKELEVFFEKCGSVTENAAAWTVSIILEMDEK